MNQRPQTIVEGSLSAFVDDDSSDDDTDEPEANDGDGAHGTGDIESDYIQSLDESTKQDDDDEELEIFTSPQVPNVVKKSTTKSLSLIDAMEVSVKNVIAAQTSNDSFQTLTIPFTSPKSSGDSLEPRQAVDGSFVFIYYYYVQTRKLLLI